MDIMCYNEPTDSITMPFGVIIQTARGKSVISRVLFLFCKGERA